MDEFEDANIFEDQNKSQENFSKNYQLYNKKFLQLEYDFQFEVANVLIFQSLKKTCDMLGFELYQQNNTQQIAINPNPYKVYSYFFNCLSFGQYRPKIIILEINIKKNQIKCCKTVEIKVVKGDQQSLNQFSRLFKQNKVVQHENSINKSVEMDSAELAYLNQGSYQEEKYESPALPSNLESNAYCHFSKVLSNQQYSIGQKVNDYISKFNSNLDFKNSPNISFQNVLQIVNKTVEVFFSDHNYAKKETKNLMSFCRLSVERYIFNKIQIDQLYFNKFQQQNDELIEKQSQIQKKLSYQQQLKYLDVEQRFLLENEDKPYQNSIKNLENISDLQSPSEKLRCLLMTHALMRSTVIEYHQGKVDICSMDEELPLIIFIIANTNCKNFIASINIVNDYINYYPQFEIEAKIMTCYLVSAQYIQNEWKIE